MFCKNCSPKCEIKVVSYVLVGGAVWSMCFMVLKLRYLFCLVLRGHVFLIYMPVLKLAEYWEIVLSSFICLFNLAECLNGAAFLMPA